MWKLLFSLCVAVLLIPNPVQGVIFYETGDPTHNTSAPSDPTLASLWNSQGSWVGYLGTPISSNMFITAKHIGGAVSQSITFGAGTPNEGTYTTTAFYESPFSDLRIVQISGTFDSWVPIATSAPLLGSQYIVFGRGTQRGDVYEFEGTDRGWLWGAADGVQRWGTGLLNGTTTSGGLQYVYDTFSGPGSVALSVGDSAGGLFVNDGGTWKLAGINYAVSGPYRETPGGTDFNASLYNQNDLYVGADPVSGSGAFFSSSVAAESAWIASVIPEPSVYAMLLGGLAVCYAVRLTRTRRA